MIICLLVRWGFDPLCSGQIHHKPRQRAPGGWEGDPRQVQGGHGNFTIDNYIEIRDKIQKLTFAKISF